MTLPDGATGRVLAAGLTVVAAVVLWVGAVGPVLGWYADREEQLADRLRLASRMEALAATVPALRDAAAGARSAAVPAGLLPENNAVLAGAALQERVQKLADATGVRLASAEVLPPEPTGTLERIALRLSLAASFPATVSMLRGLADSTPVLLVDDLHLQPGASQTGASQPGVSQPGVSQPGVSQGGGSVDVGMTVSAFRAATPAVPRP